MDFELPKMNHGTVAAGSGRLITLGGTIRTTTTVTTPIALGDGNHILIDNETDAVITSGTGDNRITEFGTGATITLGNGDNSVTDPAGGAIVTTGTGDSVVNLGGVGNTVTVGPTNGGSHDFSFINAGSGTATVTAGNGNVVVNAAGADNTITVGTGIDQINLGRMVPHGFGSGFGPGIGMAPGCDDMGGSGTSSATIPVTADKVTLGNGTNAVFLGGSGNTIYDGSGTDTISGAASGDNTFVINAAGGTDTIAGFSLTNGDVLNLASILAGVSLTPDNLSTFVDVVTQTDPRHSSWTDTVLTIKGNSGTATVTLLNTGSLTLAGLETASLVLPAH
jgi:hypothetical protein